MFFRVAKTWQARVMRSVAVLVCVLASLAQAQGYCPATISSALDATDSTMLRRLTRNGVAAVCGTAKPNPGTTGAGSSYAYETHRFANRTGASACVTFSLTAELTGTIGFHLVGYSTFVPSFPDTNYLGDSGQSVATGTVSMGLTIAAGAEVDAVVYTAMPASYGNYTLAVTGCGARAASAVALTAAPNPAVAGQLVTLSATVAGTDAGWPTGLVTFLDGSTPLASSTLDAGRASFSSTTFIVGSHPLTASYAGDDDHEPSASATRGLVVNKASTTTALTASPNPAPLGDEVTLSAKVTLVAPGSIPPTGEVSFFDASTLLGTGAVDSVGVATFSTSDLAARAHPLSARYEGDQTSSTSTSGVVSQVVRRLATSIELISSSNPAPIGASVTFTASVSGTGSATGYVTFLSGGSTIGSQDLAGGTVATLVVTTLPVGASSIVAVYSGDTANEGSSSGPVNQVVSAAGAVIALEVKPKPVSYGEPMTITATLSGPNGVPTGTVTFKDGTTVLSDQQLSGTGGAIFTGAMLTAGNHTLTINYAGDGTYDPGTGSTSQTVNKATTSTTLTSSQNPAPLGASLAFTVRVTSSGGATFTGPVELFDVSASLGTANLSNGVATFGVSTLIAGPHELTATFSGDQNYQGSTSMVVAQRITSDGGVVRVDAGVGRTDGGSQLDGGTGEAPGATGCSCNASGFGGALAMLGLMVLRGRRRH